MNKFQKLIKLCWPVHPKAVLDKSSLVTKCRPQVLPVDVTAERETESNED